MQDMIEDYADAIQDTFVDTDQVFQYNINTYTNAIPVERLVNDFNSGIIKIPAFQRPYVWQKKTRKLRDIGQAFLLTQFCKVYQYHLFLYIKMQLHVKRVC